MGTKQSEGLRARVRELEDENRELKAEIAAWRRLADTRAMYCSTCNKHAEGRCAIDLEERDDHYTCPHWGMRSTPMSTIIASMFG